MDRVKEIDVGGGLARSERNRGATLTAGIPEGWEALRLGDVCQKIGSGATPRGGNGVYLSQGISLIRSQNVYNNRFEHDGLAFIRDDHAEQLKNVVVEQDDVLLNITGDSVARACQVSKDVLPARVNQHVAIIRPRKDVLDPQYLKYYLVSAEMQSYMLGLSAAGATRHALTKGMIESFEIPAPSIDEQRNMARILGALDAKIELNRRMNETLEQIARAIFKRWFIDFEFPGYEKEKFVDGLPEGWKIQGLDEIADFLNGLALQKYRPDGEDTLPVIKIAQLRKGDSAGADQCSANLPSNYIVEDGDVLFSWSGSLEVVLWCGGRGALNQHLFKVTSKNMPKWFYYFWTKHHLQNFQEIAAHKATTMGHIQRHHLTEAKVHVPSPEVVAELDKTFSPIIERLISNAVESRMLIDIRDTLLPKLMSGEIRVSEEK